MKTIIIITTAMVLVGMVISVSATTTVLPTDASITLTNTTLNRDNGTIELSDSVPDYIHRYRFDGAGLMVYDENRTSNANGNITQWGWNTINSSPTRQEQQGVEEANGIIYSIGGMNESSVLVNFTYAYNISNNTWSTKAPAPIKVQSPILRNVSGKLYLIGGYDTTRYYNTTYMYDPAGDNWTQLANMSVGREDMASGVVGNIIYIFGGIDKQVGTHNITSRTEAYNTVTNTWSNKSNMPSPRALGDYGASYNGKVYLVSGVSDMSIYPDLIQDTTVNVYDPSLDSFSTLAPIPVGLSYKEVEVIQDRLYVFAGTTTHNSPGNPYAFVYNISTNIWSRLPDMPYAPYGMGDAVFGNTIYTVGGGTIAAHNFTYYPGATNKSSGKYGNAVNFDGKKVYIPLNNANKLLNGGTIIFFAKNWDLGTIIARDEGTTNMGAGGYVLRAAGTGSAYFRTNFSVAVQSNDNYRQEGDNIYHLYAITFNNTGRQYWRDGGNWGSKFDTATQLPGITANNTDIGRASASSNSVFLNASLDDLRIYDRFLSTTEMKSIQNGTYLTSGSIFILNQKAMSGNVIYRARVFYSGNNASFYSRQSGSSSWLSIQSDVVNNTWYTIPEQFNNMDFRIDMIGNGSNTSFFEGFEWDEAGNHRERQQNDLADTLGFGFIMIGIVIVAILGFMAINGILSGNVDFVQIVEISVAIGVIVVIGAIVIFMTNLVFNL